MPSKKNTDAEAGRACALTDLLSGAPEPTDRERVGKYVRALAEHGCSVLLIQPGTKLPADMRSSAQRRQRTRDYESVKGGEAAESKLRGGGVYQATTDTATLDGYMRQYVGQYGTGCAVNVAVNTGRSRLVVVDADTAEQVKAFRCDAQAEGDEVGPATVETPGAVNPTTGETVHSDGGHWYFTVPEGVELPRNLGELTDPEGGYAVFWGEGRYVLTPPSRRPEGDYRTTGEVRELPGWLADRITDTGRRRAERRTRSREQLDAADDGSMFTNIRRWGAEDITWDEILSGTEWMNTGMSDRCGCDIWTAPGLHASEKSATAHEPGCGHPYYAESPDPPLHIWTDHDVPPFDAYLEASGTGTGTVTRLNAWAAVHYEGDIEAAMEKLNLFDDPVTVGLDLPAPAPYADPGLPPEQRADGVKAAKVHLADVMTRNLDLFDETEVLTKLAAFAEARKVGRWTLVGGVMVRTVAALHPSVVLPATIGGEVSLNLLLAQCGVPGSGKGASDNAVSDAAVMTFGNYRTPRLPLLPIGTGEGINRAYAHAVPVPGEHRSQTVFHRRHALFSIRDIVTLEKLADRAGATIIGELLKAYMGEELGFTNAGRETNVVLPQHSYRLGLLMGVQPNRASILLDAVARGNGLTHRILALPVTDLRKRSGAPETGTPVRLKLPADLHRDPLSDDMTSMPLDVPTAIAEALIEGQNAKNLDVFGESDSTPLSGHRGLSRLKLASTLAVMHGSTSAGGVFWEMAEKFTEVSDAMMDAMVAASEHSEAIVAGEQGRRDGHRRTASDDTYRLVMVDRVRERVLTVLRQQTDWMPHSRAANAVSKRQREYLPDAVAGLLADGLIESESGEYKGQTALRYRITSA